jgi:hypothetical protein
VDMNLVFQLETQGRELHAQLLDMHNQ